MTNNLKSYLNIAMKGNTHELLAGIPESETIRIAGEITHVRELLLSTEIAGTGLVQTEVLKTIIDGADQMTCFRAALPIYQMSSKTLNINVGATTSYAPIVAEGAQVPIASNNYTPVAFSADKRAVRPVISNELLNDAVLDVIEAELAKAGKAIENSLNQDALTKMLDGAGLEQDTAGTNQGIVAVANAIAKVNEAGFVADSIIMHPEMFAMVIKEFVPSSLTSSDAILTGSLGKILGLNVFVCGVSDASVTYTWGYAADGEIGGIVFARDSAAAIGMREDISVENYSDVVSDLTGMVVKSRFDTAVLNASAICRVEY